MDLRAARRWQLPMDEPTRPNVYDMAVTSIEVAGCAGYFLTQKLVPHSGHSSSMPPPAHQLPFFVSPVGR